MDANALIQAELTRIEDEASRKTSQLLAAQDSFVAAHVLIDLLNEHGADDDLEVSPMYYSCLDTSMLIYPRGDSARTVAAIKRAGLAIDKVSEGYSNDLTRIILRGYAGVELFVRRSAMEWQVAA